MALVRSLELSGSSSGSCMASMTLKPGIGIAVSAILSVSDLKVYKTKSSCKANHRRVQCLLACVFICRKPDITEGALADTWSNVGAGPEGDVGDLSDCVRAV